MGFTKEEYYYLTERAEKYLEQKMLFKQAEYTFTSYTRAEAFGTNEPATNFVSYGTLIAKSGRKISRRLDFVVKYFEKQEQEKIKKDNLGAQ